MKMEFPKEVRRQLIAAVKSYFATERDEDLGDLQAELLLDFFVEKLGPAIYNKAIADARTFMSEKVEDLYALEKKVP